MTNWCRTLRCQSTPDAVPAWIYGAESSLGISLKPKIKTLGSQLLRTWWLSPVEMYINPIEPINSWEWNIKPSSPPKHMAPLHNQSKPVLKHVWQADPKCKSGNRSKNTTYVSMILDDMMILEVWYCFFSPTGRWNSPESLPSGNQTISNGQRKIHHL